MSITWVQDGSSRYEISSKEHLLQLMHGGTLYNDLGSSPTSYEAGSYIQTVDIDLINDHANITPGISLVNGMYDGDTFKISNWSYVGAFDDYVGLFRYNTHSTIKNIRLGGVWHAYDNFKECGFLCSNVNGGNVFNCEGDFDVGTTLGPGPVANANYVYVGVLFARLSNISTASGITVRGTVNTTEATNTQSRCGGVIGQLFSQNSQASVTNIRNLATFPNGLMARTVGGVVATCTNVPMTNVLCAMTGDITSTLVNGFAGFGGGVIGELTAPYTDCDVDNVVNSMNGNVSGRYPGGIIGGMTATNSITASRLVNYMSGDIQEYSTSDGVVGGLVARLTGGGGKTISNSINAMNGDVSKTVFGGVLSTGISTDATVDTTFGLTFETDTGSATPLTGYLNDSIFTDLPYTDMTSTDSEGNYYNWDFVYGNLAGKSAYSAYTHLSMHKGDVSYPLYTKFDLESNSTFYATFTDTGSNHMFINSSLTVLESEASVVYDYAGTTTLFPEPMTLFARPVNIVVNVTAVPEAVAYRLTYQSPTGSEITAFSGFTSLRQNIISLDPDTLYTIRLYTDVGFGFQLHATSTTTTPSDDIQNYVIDDFRTGDEYSLEGLSGSAKEAISARLNDLFSTGDEMQINNVVRSARTVTFVKKGDTIGVKDALLIPFEPGAGSSQSIVLTLENASTTTIDYDDTSNTITVQSVTRNIGDQFILDGKKVTVVDF